MSQLTSARWHSLWKNAQQTILFLKWSTMCGMGFIRLDSWLPHDGREYKNATLFVRPSWFFFWCLKIWLLKALYFLKTTPRKLVGQGITLSTLLWNAKCSKQARHAGKVSLHQLQLFILHCYLHMTLLLKCKKHCSLYMFCSSVYVQYVSTFRHLGDI